MPGYDASALLMTIAVNLRQWRTKRGLSLGDLAKASGLSKSHLWELEQATRTNPTIVTIAAVADALGISIDVLLGGATDQRVTEQEMQLVLAHRAIFGGTSK